MSKETRKYSHLRRWNRFFLPLKTSSQWGFVFWLNVNVVLHAAAAVMLSATNIVSLSGASEGTIAMQEGEVLAVVEEDKGDGWTRVRRNNGDEGYIPTSYVTISLNEWRTRGKKRRRNDHFTKLYTVLPMGPIKKEPQHYRQDNRCIRKGIQTSCFDFLREVPKMGRGMMLTVCSSWLTLH